MSDHTITVRSIDEITHDVRRYRCTKPDGYSFTPGQATELALDREGWRDEKRPFTFTSLPDDDVLEFTIKSYPDHDGVTEQIGHAEAGDRFLIGDAWGAIEDNGPGTFIAGGAGVTPFIAILRARHAAGDLDGCHLIFSNLTERDIILRDEFEAMPGLRTTFLVTEQPDSPLAADLLDRDALRATHRRGRPTVLRLRPACDGRRHLRRPPADGRRPRRDHVREVNVDPLTAPGRW